MSFKYNLTSKSNKKKILVCIQDVHNFKKETSVFFVLTFPQAFINDVTDILCLLPPGLVDGKENNPFISLRVFCRAPYALGLGINTAWKAAMSVSFLEAVEVRRMGIRVL